jgi:hypothetical protein
VVLASDNLTYLPTPQLTTREQPFHIKHVPASYISRPYTIIAFLFFEGFRFGVPRQSIENRFTPEFYSRCRVSPVWSCVEQLHASDRDKAVPEDKSTIESPVLAKLIKARVDSEVTRGDMQDTRSGASSLRICSREGIHQCDLRREIPHPSPTIDSYTRQCVHTSNSQRAGYDRSGWYEAGWKAGPDALIVQRKLYDLLCEGYVVGLGRGLSLLHELFRKAHEVEIKPNRERRVQQPAATAKKKHGNNGGNSGSKSGNNGGNSSNSSNNGGNNGAKDKRRDRTTTRQRKVPRRAKAVTTAVRIYRQRPG